MVKFKYITLGTLGVETTDCFSLLTKYRGFDFATPSDRAKNDIYCVISFYISAVNIGSSSSVLLTKSQLSFFRVKMKLQ